MIKKNKIKIVHVVGGLNFGGVEAVLINYFSNINLENYDLTVISHEKSNKECKEQFEKIGFTIYEVPSKKENLKENIKQIYNILKKEKPDIVHSHLTLSNYAPLFIAWICKVRVRISHSHLVYERKNIIQKLHAFLSNLSATHYMACGEAAAKYLFGKKRGKKSKVYILNNAVDISKFQYLEKTRSEIRKELGIEEKFVVGHIGRFHEQKNHEFLITAFKEVIKQNDNAVLLLIGNGKLKEKIKNQIERENIQDNVIILSGKNNIYDYYQAMDLFVLPSLYEGLGMVLIEAQISGLPCLASSTIPNEVKITPLLKFLDINSTSIWSEQILKSKCNYNRLQYIDEVKKSGYDIRKEAEKLDKFYKKVKGEKNVRYSKEGNIK